MNGILERLDLLFGTGGPVLAILAGLSVVALTIVLVKLWQFWVLRIGDRRFIPIALSYWQAGQGGEALRELEGLRNPVARVMQTTLRDLLEGGHSEPKVREEANRLGVDRLRELRRYLRILEVIATLSPLLGLLGTVLGMIDAFQQMETAGDRVNPALLSGGVWEALLTTAAGLAVAIPTVFALNLLEGLVEAVRHRMEDALTQIFTRQPAAGGRAELGTDAQGLVSDRVSG